MNPERFDADGNDGSKVFAFGRGSHHCIGQRFAEIEGAIAIAALFRRFPQARLRDGQAVWAHHHMMVAVPSSLPMVPILLE
jgi:cytochrome P450